MTFSLDQIVVFLCIIVRISTFVYTAPFFNLRNVPRTVKVGISIAVAVILFEVLPVQTLVYKGVVGFGFLVVKEAFCGLVMGFFANVCSQILAFAGQMIDMEIGFAMVNEFDPISSAQVTITANFYQYAVMLMLFITNMHHYILQALIDSFQVIPVGEVIINPNIFKAFVTFIVNYFVIGFRIVLPVFAALLIVNTVLAILAKVAPQMNMFVIGMQLKVFIGLLVLLFIVSLIPSVSDFIFNEMMTMIKSAIAYMR